MQRVTYDMRTGAGVSLKVDLSLAGEDCQHGVTDESPCTVTGCALETDVAYVIG